MSKQRQPLEGRPCLDLGNFQKILEFFLHRIFSVKWGGLKRVFLSFFVFESWMGTLNANEIHMSEKNLLG